MSVAPFHLGDGLSVRRTVTGDVLATLISPDPRAAPIEVVIPSGIWASGVAAVSGWAGHEDAFRRALVFHNGVGRPSPEVLAQRIAAAEQPPDKVAALMRESVARPDGAEAGPEI